MTGIVLNPVTSNNPISATPLSPTLGRQGELLIAGLHGKYGTAAINKALFNFNVTAQTVPLVSSGQTSVFSVWNPPSSSTLAEMVDTEIGQVLATTVVNTIGWYVSTGSAALAGTFTTKGVPFGASSPNYFSARAGDIPNGQMIPYTSYTHSGIPARIDIIGAFGATSDAGMTLPNKVYDGRLWLTPGNIISAMVSTQTFTSAGLDVSCRWTEWPFV